MSLKVVPLVSPTIFSAARALLSATKFWLWLAPATSFQSQSDGDWRPSLQGSMSGPGTLAAQSQEWRSPALRPARKAGVPHHPANAKVHRHSSSPNNQQLSATAGGILAPNTSSTVATTAWKSFSASPESNQHMDWRCGNLFMRKMSSNSTKRSCQNSEEFQKSSPGLCAATKTRPRTRTIAFAPMCERPRLLICWGIPSMLSPE